MKVTLGFSPCPNDTFIFDALVNKKIDTCGIDFDFVMDDVESLNQWALQGKLNISKISYGVLPLVLDDYVLMNNGGALGKKVGPILIGLRPQNQIHQKVNKFQIALPGEHTTAHLLFCFAFPEVTNKCFLKYHEIEGWIKTNNQDNEVEKLGVIIHENRFTYEERNFHKVLDLGEYWELKTSLPIPLGGIVAKRGLGKSIISKINELIKQSLEYAYQHSKESLPAFIKENAQEMEEKVMWQHIHLYVNDYSLELGLEGKRAVMKLLEVFSSLHNNQHNFERKNVFADED